MLKIVNSPTDLRGLDRSQFYTVHRVEGDATELVAIASSREEAYDAQDMLNDLKKAVYHVSSPKSESN